MSLADISGAEMAAALVNNGIDPGNIRKLRSLIGQIYRRAREFGAGLWKFDEELSKHVRERLKTEYDPYPELRILKSQDYERVLACLESQHDRWQHAMCIRLYLELGAPLTRLTRAEWREIYDNYWYPYLPANKKYWFESREHLKEKCLILLSRVNEFVRKDFNESLYLFPSKHSGGESPICTVESAWRSVLRTCGFHFYPLRHFAMRFGRRRNNPSYYSSMLHQYGGAWREMENTAYLSRIVTGGTKSRLNSKTYHVGLALSQNQGPLV